MKYIFINIKNFIKRETVVFCLVVLCILCSVIIINFSFGFYHHLEQKKLDSDSGMKELTINFQDAKRTTVTKGSLIEALCQLDNSVLENCIISFEGRFAEDKTENPAIDNTMLVEFMPFSIQDGMVTVAPLEQEWKETSTIVDGSYFTAAQVENAELVCLAPIVGEYEGEEATWAKRYSAIQNGKYMIHGKEYTCIGHVDWYSIIPMVPVTTVEDSCYIQRVSFTYKNILKRKDYMEISELMREIYGDMADIPVLDIQEVDSLRFYDTLLILCIILIGMSGIVLSLLYEYILLRRKRQLTIYRICGITRGQAKILYFMECLFPSVVLYLIAILFFHFVLLPYFSDIFEYITTSYSLFSYGMLGIMYISITSIILYIMICRQMGQNVVNELREV